MSRVINFSAGPASLPKPVLNRIKEELPDWQGLGVSVMELGHRTKAFTDMGQATEEKLRRLLNIPSNYRVLFLLGGARVHFAMIPLNIANEGAVADYINTGFWSQCAIQEAMRYIHVNVVAELDEQVPLSIPARASWQLSANPTYCYYTDNETITGLEFHQPPSVGEVPLICDMTSSLLCKEIDVKQYGLIFASTQKNLGISGMCVVIVRDDLIQAPSNLTPAALNYQIQAQNKSLLVTPPTFNWYVAGLVADWMLENGGLSHFAAMNERKAQALYQLIDGSDFYYNFVDCAYRSRMNVTFRLQDAELEQQFLQEAQLQGLLYLKGHSKLGGIRASIYNAISEQDVRVLCDFMTAFAKKFG